jgi:hypothetical protein
LAAAAAAAVAQPWLVEVDYNFLWLFLSYQLVAAAVAD